MEPGTLEQLLSAWWQILLVLLGLAASIIAIRVRVNFDVNQWLQDRREASERKAAMKMVERCGHIWTLFPQSEFSQCNGCMALIKTSTLLFANQHMDIKPIILATRTGITITPGAGIIAIDYVGKRTL